MTFLCLVLCGGDVTHVSVHGDDEEGVAAEEVVYVGGVEHSGRPRLWLIEINGSFLFSLFILLHAFSIINFKLISTINVFLLISGESLC